MKIKNLFFVVLTICILCMHTITPTYALTEFDHNSIIYLDNGYYIVVTIDDQNSISTYSSTKNASKTYSGYHEGNLLWQFTLTGNFQYDGTTSKCLNVSYSTANIASGWRLDNYAIWVDGNKAKSEAVFKKKLLFIDVDTKECNITITCDKNGKIS